MSEIEFERLKRELKTLLAGYKKLTPEMIKKLESMGFVFVRKRTHYIFDFPVQGKTFVLKLLELQAIAALASRKHA